MITSNTCFLWNKMTNSGYFFTFHILRFLAYRHITFMKWPAFSFYNGWFPWQHYQSPPATIFINLQRWTWQTRDHAIFLIRWLKYISVKLMVYQRNLIFKATLFFQDKNQRIEETGYLFITIRKKMTSKYSEYVLWNKKITLYIFSSLVDDVQTTYGEPWKNPTL